MANEKIVTGPFRLAFPTLFEPRAFTDGSKPKYSIVMLFPKNGESLLPKIGGPGIMELRKLAMAAVKEKWGEDKAKWPPTLRALDLKSYLSLTGKDGFPLRDGSTVNWAGAGPGTVVVKATANPDYPPKVVDQRKDDILDKSKILSGMICRAVIRPFAYDRPDSKGVSFGLNIIQLVKDDGVRFGGGDNSSYMDQLAPIEGGEDDPNNYQNDDL